MQRLLFALLVLVSTATLSFSADGPDPGGVWMRGDGNAKVRIAPCGGKVCATNLWIKDTSGGEEVGDRLIMTLTPKSADTLAGTAFDPKREMSYAITLTVGKDRLVTRGCIVGGILCKDVGWQATK